MRPVALSYWYLGRGARVVGQATVTIIKKIALDQFVMSPPFYVIFDTLMSLLEGREDITRELR